LRLRTLISRLVRCLHICGLIIAGIGAATATELRYGVRGLPLSLGDPYVADGPAVNTVLSALFDGLTRLDSNGNPAPGLAASWENITQTSWRFKLRRDAVFSNGEPFNADAVVATVSWLQSSEGARTAVARHVRGIAQIEIEDAYSVVVHTINPDAILPNRLSAVAIVAPDAWRQLGPEAFAATPAGTGAFAISDWEITSGRIALQANPDSWRAPKVDNLVIISFPDPGARAQALLSGRVHIASGLGLENIDVVQAGGAFVTAAPAMSVAAIALRQDDGRASPLKDIRVRQALNHAIDKTNLNSAVFRGLAAPAGQPAGRWTSGHNPNIRPYPHDPELARALLFDAGIVTSFGLRFDVVTGRTPGDAAMLEYVATQLREIGIDAEMRSIPYGRWLESFASGIWPNDTDGFLLSFDAMPINDVQSALEPYSCDNLAPFFCDKEISAEVSMATEEMNFADRLKLLDKVAEKINELAPAIFLTEQFDLFAISRQVSGFAVAGRVPIYEEISLEE
jgi:peptide/nickel transport system substrate-binding protein